MFAPLEIPFVEIPFGCVMLFNVVDLKDGVKIAVTGRTPAS